MVKKKTILDAVHLNYNQKTNMTLKELRAWAKNPLSKKASLNRKPLMMAIRLKSKPKKKWGITEVRWALRKALPFLKKAKKIKRSKLKIRGYTRNQIMLKNWGYDVKKKRSKK